MRSLAIAWFCFAFAAAVSFGPSAPAVAQPPSDSAPGVAEGMEVLNRGPVHEAYAQPGTTDQAKGLIVPKRPPELIEEVPPDVKPEADAIWIGGYWSWDDDRGDFIWVSGVWRTPPPGYSWVPGYWTPSDGGHRWVSGFWDQAASDTVEYLPAPPVSLEQGPNSASPGESHFWIPGCWQWRQTRYAWRPGYWAPIEPDWVWVPASYYWTPRGWVYCAGYWDYPLIRRGLIFAPVRFVHPVYLRPRFFYRPAVVIDAGILTMHFFARPLYGHYYFGDYYAPYYETWGFCPWFASRYRSHFFYDPIFIHHRWHYRGDPHWVDHLHGWHRYYRAHEDLRPPRTMLAAEAMRVKFEGRRDVSVVHNLMLAKPVDRFQKDPKALVRVTPVGRDLQKHWQESIHQSNKFRMERLQLETRAAGAMAKRPPGAAALDPRREPEKVRLPKAPTLSAVGAHPSGVGRVGPALGGPGPAGSKPPGAPGRTAGHEKPGTTLKVRPDTPPRTPVQPGQPAGKAEPRVRTDPTPPRTTVQPGQPAGKAEPRVRTDLTPPRTTVHPGQPAGKAQPRVRTDPTPPPAPRPGGAATGRSAPERSSIRMPPTVPAAPKAIDRTPPPTPRSGARAAERDREPSSRNAPDRSQRDRRGGRDR